MPPIRMARAAALAALAALLLGAPAIAQTYEPAPAYPPQPAPAYPAAPSPTYQPPPGTPTYEDAPSAAAPTPASPSTFSAGELVSAGHQLFGDVSQGLAGVVEHAVASYGLPNGYILGQEGSGAIIGGARYGEGVLYTRNAGQHRVYWQGPSIGLDVGANGDRTMMLVYNLPSVEAIFQRFLGVNGSAYVVAGFGMTVLSRNGVYVVPIVSGVGARLGINFGYLKFTANPTWNPF